MNELWIDGFDINAFATPCQPIKNIYGDRHPEIVRDAQRYMNPNHGMNNSFYIIYTYNVYYILTV